MDHATRALELFHGKRTCAQALLAAYGPDLELSQTLAEGVARAFVGGMAFTGATCGVVTAALMVLGLRYDMAEANACAKLFLERFADRHGTVACNALLGCDISTDEGRQNMQARNLRETRCAGLLADGCAILDTLLAGDQDA